MTTDPPELAHKIVIDSLTETPWVYKEYDPQETKLQIPEQKHKEKINKPNSNKKKNK